jgi:hypothetical protein
VKSHIVKHWMTTHPSLPNPPKMGFKITGRFKDCLSRQVSEALKISWSKDSILNSKAEYGHNTVSRLSVVEDVWERRDRERLEEEQEEIRKELVAKFRMEKSAFNKIQPSGRSGVITPTGTVCNIVSEERYENDNENDNENDRQPENDNEQASPDQTTTTSNGPSNGSQVTLGQSNGSPRTPLVYTKGGYGGQDEHPWLKVIHEGVDENGGGLEGGGGEDDKRVDPIIYYETDEDEFLDINDHSPAVATREPALLLRKGTHKSKNTAKRDVVALRRGGSGSEYDLAYFKLWWARMAIEGRKQAKEQLRQEEDFKMTKGAGRMRMNERMYVNIRRGPQTANKEMVSTNQNQLNNPQDQKSLRGGHCLEGDHSFVGVGRGSPVSDIYEVIYEQPRDCDMENVSEADTGTGSLNLIL